MKKDTNVDAVDMIMKVDVVVDIIMMNIMSVDADIITNN